MENFEIIKSAYEEIYNNDKKKHITIFTIALIISSLITITGVIFYKNSDLAKSTFYIFLVITITVGIIALVTLTNFKSKKGKYTYLFEKAIESINEINKLNISYTPLSKEKDFVKSGGVFTRFSQVTNNYKISFTTDASDEINIYDTLIITQTDKSRTVHFDGCYIVLPIDNDFFFQLREKGRPALAGERFEQIKTREDIKEFIEKHKSYEIDNKYYDLYDQLKNSYFNSKIFIGCSKKIHVCIWRENKDQAIKELTPSVFDSIENELLKKVELSKDILNKLKSNKSFF